MNHEIQCIISGKSEVKYGANIQTVIGFLAGSQESGSMAKTDKHFRREETKRLKGYRDSQGLFY